MLMSQKITPAESIDSQDPTASSRKRDHIELAFRSQVAGAELDQRFYYEPVLSGHPASGSFPRQQFLGKELQLPLWVSSMTGGTEMARTINHNLARACGEFGMGMGLGSCRSLLFSDETLSDFDVRHLISDAYPLYANLGIAQVEELIQQGDLQRIERMLDKLRADGLIIHINPLQEWLQPEGDRFRYSPLETITHLLEKLPHPLIVKEVGQGMGKESLAALLRLPLAAVDFAASGGTNFSKLELLRGDEQRAETYAPLVKVGHTAADMVHICNELLDEIGAELHCRQLIISGGVRTYLDGYYLTRSARMNSIYGQASGFLKHARGDYATLQRYVAAQQEGLELANAFLRVRS